MDIQSRLKAVAVGILLAGYLSVPAIAEDIEIYTVANVNALSVQPNVVFLVDTSGSMGDPLLVPTKYDYTTTYSGCYDPALLYYTSSGALPACGSKAVIFKTSNKCDASLNLYDKGVIIDPIGPLESNGFFSDQIAQFNSKKNLWQATATKNANESAYYIECITDSGVHGESGSSKPYITDGGTGWTSTAPPNPSEPHLVWANGDNNLQLYDGNYLNYRTDPSVGTTATTRIEVVKEAVKAVVDTNNNINIGLMRFDGASSEGGAVMYPALDVKASRNDFNSRLKTMTAGGGTPLSEAYYEALRYFGGKAVDYGDTASPSNQTGTLENGNPKFYETPITNECQKNYIIFLSDGAPTLDYLNPTRRGSLTGFDAGSCNTDPDPGFSFNFEDYNKNAFTSASSTNDNCLDELAGWAKNFDIAERSFPEHDGDQHVVTYTVGFDFPASASNLEKAGLKLLQDAADAGGGEFYEAKSKDSLLNVFNEILAEVLAVNSTFSSPAVSVNAFNRATNLDDLYFSLFKPAVGAHWDGNLKKYKLGTFVNAQGDKEPIILDANGNPAVDPVTGFFTDSAVSFWTPVLDQPDGAETAVGGAASKLGLTRNLYTYTGSYNDVNGLLVPNDPIINQTSNELDKANSAVTDTMLGVAGFPEIFTGVPYRDTLLDWAFGIDVLGPNPALPRRIIGDPLHAEPALVQYDELANGDPDLVAFLATNDGYLHAIDSITGNELWAFVPQELLMNLNTIFEDSSSSGKSYALDSNVVPWINDANADGDLKDSGDHVYLYFGQRRGGNNIYSIDVSDRNNPKLRWVIQGGVGDFAEMGQSWSIPNVERLRMSGSTKNVLIFGGGYDTGQDTASVRVADSVGRGVYIVDADTGQLLWRAGPDAGADLQLTEMQYSIPARVKPIDVDSNGYTDQLYVGDMGGQIWRFDIEESETSSSLPSLITGGRIADLAQDASVNDARRFYYPPDVALIIESTEPPYLSVAATSGFRSHPLNTDIHDRMYMLRQDDVYDPPTTYETITESDLFDTTLNLIGEGTAAQKQAAATDLGNADGWFITFNEPSGAFIGEKGLSEPLILGGVIIATTFIPADVGPSTTSCTPKAGTGLLYFVNVVDGTPTYNLAGTVDKEREDRKTYLQRGGIPPTPSIIITEGGTPTLCIGTECEAAGLDLSLQKSYWYEVEQ